MTKDFYWSQLIAKSPELGQMEGMKEMLFSGKVLLNCGIFGGEYEPVRDFLGKLVKLIEKYKSRLVDSTTDVPLFNYVGYRYFNPIHGAPVNSIFKGYEKRDDVWFIHK